MKYSSEKHKVAIQVHIAGYMAFSISQRKENTVNQKAKEMMRLRVAMEWEKGGLEMETQMEQGAYN